MMAECPIGEVNKNINSSSKQSCVVPSCEDLNNEEVMEPLLLEDFRSANIPTSLTNILKLFDSQNGKPSKTEFLVGCVYVLMLEYGFVPRKMENLFIDSNFNYTRIKEISHGLVENSPRTSIEINKNLYSASFVLPPDGIYVCRISCIRIAEELIINAAVQNLKDTNRTVMLDILSYFTDGLGLNADLKRIQNMRELSILFKDQIAFPIKHAILRKREERHPSLEDLPVELVHYIFKYLNGKSIVKLTSTCKRFYTIRQDATLWSHLLKRDYDYSMKNEDYTKLMRNYASLGKPLKLGANDIFLYYRH